MPVEELSIQRSSLIRLLGRSGPDNERIKDRLVDWAERAQSFGIWSPLARSPLVQIGITGIKPPTTLLTGSTGSMSGSSKPPASTRMRPIYGWPRRSV